jgi:hypothetical protein
MRKSSIVLLVVACWAVISLSAASSTVQPSDNDSSEGSQVSKVVSSRFVFPETICELQYMDEPRHIPRRDT